VRTRRFASPGTKREQGTDLVLDLLLVDALLVERHHFPVTLVQRVERGLGLGSHRDPKRGFPGLFPAAPYVRATPGEEEG